MNKKKKEKVKRHGLREERKAEKIWRDTERKIERKRETDKLVIREEKRKGKQR